jgi:hypothetical protein
MLPVAMGLAAGAAPTDSRADVTVGLEIEHRTLVQFESVNAMVSLSNLTDVPIVLGTNRGNARLTFQIKLGRDAFARRIKAGPLTGSMRITPGEKQLAVCDLAQWYDLATTRSYTIQAVLEWDGRQYGSNLARIDIVPGLPLKSVAHSVPGHPGRVRTYQLIYLGRGGNEHLFLRVDEQPSGMNYGLFPLGSIVRVFDPVIEVATDGTVKILHQSSLDRFALSTFASRADGVTFVDQVHHNAGGRPYPSVLDVPLERLRPAVPPAPR